MPPPPQVGLLFLDFVEALSRLADLVSHEAVGWSFGGSCLGGHALGAWEALSQAVVGMPWMPSTPSPALICIPFGPHTGNPA